MDSSQESEMHLMTCRLTAEETASIFDVDPEFGLDQPAIVQRRSIHQMEHKQPLWKISLIRNDISNIIVKLLLLGLAVGSMYHRKFESAIAYTVALVIVSTIHFVQVYNSVKSQEDQMPKCHCRREGKKETFIPDELVPGDIVELCAGDRVLADLRLTQAVDLAIDESIFTGDTLPSLKTVAPLPKSEALNNGVSNVTCMAFSGTLVMCGRGQGIVIGTAPNSEFFKMMEKSKMRRQMTSRQACRLTVEETASIFDVDPKFGLDRPHFVRERSILDFIDFDFKSTQEAPLWKKYLEQLHPFMILFILEMLVNLAFCMLTGEVAPAIFITVVVVILASAPFGQMYMCIEPSELPKDALPELVPPKAKCRCRREGKQETLFASELVLGDIVELCVGDRVPAELRLTQAVNLHIEEFRLTEKISPSLKNVAPVPNGVSSTTCIALMGTIVSRGRGQGIVIGTAANTELFKVIENERLIMSMGL